MDMFDEAAAIRSTMQLCNMTQSELARQLGVSQSYVANKLRLLGFSENMRELIRRSGVSERHARALLRLDEDEQERVLSEVVKRSLTVRECEAIVDSQALSHIPNTVGRAVGAERISAFKKAIDGGVSVLAEAGVEARARTSYLGSDMYITVCIKNA